MRPRLTTTTLATYGVISLAGAIPFLLPGNLGPSSAKARPAGPPGTITILGVVRDFLSSHADFNRTPVGGNGHFAGNVALTLGADERPTFVGGGYRVATQWRNSAGNPIAPHLYMNGWGVPGTIPVTIASPSPSHGTLDTYNSANGPYGGANIGPAPTYLVSAPMPVITVPSAVSNLPTLGNVSYSGIKLVSSDIHCNRLDCSGTLRINGDRTILCDDVMALSTWAAITLNPSATLRVYVRNGGSDWNHVVIGDPLNPSRVTIYNMGTTKFIIHNQANVYAMFVSPNASLELSNHGALYGRFVGKTVEYDNHGDFHVDRSPIRDMCGAVINDTAGSKGVASTGGISSAATFSQWFTDTLGANLSTQYGIVLTRNASGVYEYLDDNFHPIDGMLLGNEGQAHNNFLTFAFSVPFTHHACSGGFIEFQGADDLWLFIDGAMVLDLGGIQQATSQRFDLSRLRLVDGRVYRINLFYAQRNVNSSSFRLRTNLDLIQEYVPPTITAVGD